MSVNEEGVIVGVQDYISDFFQYLDCMELILGIEIKLFERYVYDDLVKILFSNEKEIVIFKKVSQYLFI